MSEYVMISDAEKLDALFNAIKKIDRILDDLNDSVFGYLPLCSDYTEQQRLDRLFLNSNGMDGILSLDSLLRNAKNTALSTIHKIGKTTEAEFAY